MQSEAEHCSLPDALRERAVEPAATQKAKVLIVDTDLRMLRMYRTSLPGFDVHTVLETKAALKLLSIIDYDAVFCDITPSGEDGLQLLRTIREWNLDVPVVLMSGAPTAEIAIQSIEYGAYRFLVKP